MGGGRRAVLRGARTGARALTCSFGASSIAKSASNFDLASLLRYGPPTPRTFLAEVFGLTEALFGLLRASARLRSRLKTGAKYSRAKSKSQ